MFTKIENFEKSYKIMVEGTQKIMDALTDESLQQSVADDHRTLGRMAWHIVTTIPEMMGEIGLKFEALKKNAPLPTTAEDIQNGYRAVTGELLKQVTGEWKDETLFHIDELYGEKWPRGLTLRILVNHEIHHRGQMTVLMRQAGLPVPGVLGPAKEEWTVYGMPPPEI
ncbi:MAG: DinB family protein [candidate division Zixibacteria bacterium]|nr:DinB family protein [candidate division Zixibacteria bacterium]